MKAKNEKRRCLSATPCDRPSTGGEFGGPVAVTMQDSPISSGIGIHNRPGGAILRWRSLHYWCRRRAAYEVALLFEAEPLCVEAARVLPTAGGNA